MVMSWRNDMGMEVEGADGSPLARILPYDGRGRGIFPPNGAVSLSLPRAEPGPGINGSIIGALLQRSPTLLDILPDP